MKMQQDRLKVAKLKAKAETSSSLKERQLFYPAAFEHLEAVVTNNFNSVTNLDQDKPYPLERQQEVKFYASSLLANQAYKGELLFALMSA